jgi:HSP20 family protein
MPSRDIGSGLLAEALELLREADRMQRQFFTLSLGHTGPCWEPPVDVIESGSRLTIHVALPGVRSDAAQVATDGASLHVVGLRRLPAGAGDTIHRLEVPHGRFERRIALPPGRYELLAREFVDGCLVLRLQRLA